MLRHWSFLRTELQSFQPQARNRWVACPPQAKNFAVIDLQPCLGADATAKNLSWRSRQNQISTYISLCEFLLRKSGSVNGHLLSSGSLAFLGI
jgi:hypothetical protein